MRKGSLCFIFLLCCLLCACNLKEPDLPHFTSSVKPSEEQLSTPFVSEAIPTATAAQDKIKLFVQRVKLPEKVEGVLLRYQNEGANQAGYFNVQGEKVFECPRTGYAYDFYDGYGVFSFWDAERRSCGLINANGQTVIAYVTESAVLGRRYQKNGEYWQEFVSVQRPGFKIKELVGNQIRTNPVYILESNGVEILVNIEGMVLANGFENVQYASDDMVFVRYNQNKYEFVNVLNGTVEEFQTEYKVSLVCEEEKLLIYSIEDEFWGEVEGYMDYYGNVVIPAQYPWANTFSEGLAAVAVSCPENPVFDLETGESIINGYGTKHIFIDRKGNQAFEGEYDYAESFSNGRALVSNEVYPGMTGERFVFQIIDINGNRLGQEYSYSTYEPYFGSVSYHEGYLEASVDETTIAYVDIDGNELFRYDLYTGEIINKG